MAQNAWRHSQRAACRVPGPELLMDIDSIGVHDSSMEDTVIAHVIHETREGQRRLSLQRHTACQWQEPKLQPSLQDPSQNHLEGAKPTLSQVDSSRTGSLAFKTFPSAIVASQNHCPDPEQRRLYLLPPTSGAFAGTCPLRTSPAQPT